MVEAEIIARAVTCSDFRDRVAVAHNRREKVLAELLQHGGVSRSSPQQSTRPCCSWLTKRSSGKELAEPSVSMCAGARLVVLAAVDDARGTSNQHVVRRRQQRSARKAAGALVSMMAAPA